MTHETARSEVQAEHFRKAIYMAEMRIAQGITTVTETIALQARIAAAKQAVFLYEAKQKLAS